MILRAIVAAVALFLIWMTAIQHLPADLDTSQTMWGENVIHAQDYLYTEICQADKAVAIREGFRAVFPPTEFTYVPQPECADYSTTDGHHLGERSLAIYSKWLRKEIAPLLE